MDTGIEHQEKKVRKMTKKKKIIIGIVVLVVALALGGAILFRNLLTEREPITVETFVEVMYQNDYRISNTMDQSIGTAFEGYVYTLLVAESENHQFELYEMTDSRNAQIFYEDLVRNSEYNHGLSTSHSSMNGVNFDTFQVTTSDSYAQILRIDSIVIYALGDKSDRSDVRNMFKLLQKTN